MMWRRWATTLFVFVLVSSLFVGAAACSGDDSSSTNTDGGQPAGDAQSDPVAALVDSKCSLCHTLDRVNSAEKDKAAWEETVARMRKNGAVMTDEEAQQIVDYLASR